MAARCGRWQCESESEWESPRCEGLCACGSCCRSTSSSQRCRCGSQVGAQSPPSTCPSRQPCAQSSSPLPRKWARGSMRASGSGGSAPGTAWGSGSACVERCEPSCWGLAREPTGGATGPLQGPKVRDGEWGPWRLWFLFVIFFWLSFDCLDIGC